MAVDAATALTQSFRYEDRYLIPWTRLGPPSAQPVVFIHGTPWSSRLWAPFALALSSTYSVYLFDNPGYGESQTFGEGTSEQANDGPLEKQAEVFAALLKHWGLDKAPHVVAHDNAGLASLRAVLTHGCRYRSLCLVDVVAVGPWGLPFFQLVSENSEVFNQIPADMFQGIVRGFIRSAAFKPLNPSAEEMLAKPWLSDGKQGQSGFIRQMCQAARRRSADVEPRYREVGTSGLPVKIIWGKDDQWLPVEKAEKMRELIGGNTEVVIVEDAGHLIHLDQPERLMAELLLFLNKLDSQ
ncbi:MAG: hypothetical protein M1833_002077 [Piccolia ochrophora]|nr:MAG: hypothetical protein M1833_002077 [Piccolia ochrophora]